MKNIGDEVEVFKTEPTALDLVSGGAIMQRQATAYVTAVSVVLPRKLSEVEMRVKSEVELDPLGAFYGWEVTLKDGKKKYIEGHTIGLAMSIARNYGNCAVDVEIEETPTHYTFIPIFFDLETGFTFRRAYRQCKSQGIGMKDKDRAEDITFQIGQSKAIRNVIGGAVPKALISNAIEYAHQIERNKMTPEKIADIKAKSIEAFKKDFKVSIEQLGEYMGDPDPAKWSVDKVIELRSIYRALQSGDLTVQDVFPLTDDENPEDKAPLNIPGKKKKKELTPEPETPAENETPKLDYKNAIVIPKLIYERAGSPDANGNYHQNDHVFNASAEYLCEVAEYLCEGSEYQTKPNSDFDPKKEEAKKRKEEKEDK